MAVYHQMGHQSRNLLDEQDLAAYQGAVFSPVNYVEDSARSHIADCGSPDFEFVFDPQLYYPNTARGHLPQWSYFPSDVDTADLASSAWWKNLVINIADTVRRIHAPAVCSPAIVPRVYSLDYYSLNCDVALNLRDLLSSDDTDILLSLLVRMESLADPRIAPEIASIVTGTDIDRAYLVFITNVRPRLELRAEDELKGALRLIRYLEDASVRILVGFTSSDIILWKVAGATDCATGKYFNLRRFTPSRWEPPPEGGGQLPYWFEESMMAFLREGDLIRVRNAGLLSQRTLSNPYGMEILDILANQPSLPWLGLSWRHYLRWFADIESWLVDHPDDYDLILRGAEQTWNRLDSTSLLMEERSNDGQWLRSWRRALVDAYPN